MKEVDPAQARADEVMKCVKGPLHETIRMVERLAEEFPSDKDFHFYSNFPLFKNPVLKIQAQVDSLLNDLGRAKNLRSETAAFPRDPDESYDWLVALQDDFVEGIDTAIDQFNKEKRDGKRGKNEVAYEPYQTPKKLQRGFRFDDSPNESVKIAKGMGSGERRVPFHVRSIPRPQDKFDLAVDNSSTPFKHPQAAVSKVETKKEGVSALDLHARKLGVSFEDIHPLEEELNRMEYANEALLEVPIPQDPRPLTETPLTFVSTLSELNDMAAKLRAAGEIAVDLENHHYRSFQGFVCLMQVSTRSEDFIVDTLALRSHMYPCLKEIFADPGIRKVMHGADRDIVWLQRDFGIYVCNMFDTGQAARVLQMEGCGLAFLLQYFLDIHPDKRYQLADWRIRPLPAEMIKYAREDTHYLLYIYDMLRVQLVSLRSRAENDVDDALLQVYKQSRDVCLQIYKKEVLTETSHLNLFGLQDRQLTAEQMSVLAGLYAWRDCLARKEDESTGYVLPNQLLYRLAEEMPDIPRKLHSLIRGPHSLVHQHAASVLEVIRQSREQAAVAASATLLAEREQIDESARKVVTDTQAVVGSALESDTVQMEGAAMVTAPASGPEAMEEGEMPTPTEREVVDVESAPHGGLLAEQDAQGERPHGESGSSAEKGLKSATGETTSFKEITVGTSISAQVMVKITAVEDTSLASTISIRRLPAAVVRRAVAPSLALFGAKPKSRAAAIPLDLNIQTDGVGSSSRSDSLNPVSSSSNTEVAKPASVSVGQHSSEPADVGSLPSPSDGKPIVEIEASKGSAEVAGQEVADSMPGTLSVETQSEEKSVTPEVRISNLADSLAATSGSVQSVQENSGRTSMMEAPSSVARNDDDSETTVPGSKENLPEAGLVPSTSRRDGKAVDGVATNASLEKQRVTPAQISFTANTQGSDSGIAVIGPSTAHQNLSEGSKPMKVLGGTPKMSGGLGALLGSSARSKVRRGPDGDRELMEAKLRADQIRASVSLPFHRVQLAGTPSVQEPPPVIPASPQSGLPEPSPPSQPPGSGGQAASLDELEDYVMVDGWDRAPEKRVTKDAAVNKYTQFSGREEEIELPTPLSEVQRHRRQQQKEGRSTDFSHSRKQEGRSKPGTMMHADNAQDKPEQQQSKRQKNRKSIADDGPSDVQPNQGAGEESVFKPFDYGAARRDIGLEGNLSARAEDTQSSRGRGRASVNPNKRQKQAPPPRAANGAREAFDPLRRVRQEPRPDGIPAAKRRQVFPQTGNRTATFRR